MKIAVITSSPHKNGSSNLLASEFIRGAEEKGHTSRSLMQDTARYIHAQDAEDAG